MTEFLYREFCNHVYIGQWELARACALALINNEDSSDSKQLLVTLQNIAKNPYLVRSAWTTVSCPSYFSFLSCQLLLDIKCQEEVKTWRRLADFHILLESFFQDSKPVLAELSSTHSHLLKLLNEASQSKITDSSFVISSDSVSFLRNAFSQNPVAISKLLNMMHVPRDLNVDSNINYVICDIHCQHLLKCLKSVKSNSVKNNKSNNLRESILNIYFLLSILPTFALDIDRKLSINEVLSFVLQLCNSKILDMNRVYQSFLCQSTTGLYHYFYNFQKNKLVHQSNEDFSSCEKFPKCYSWDGDFSHQNALLSSIDSSSHFLQDLMDFFMENIISGNWTYVQNTLKDSLLSLLKPLLLILSWRICQDDASAMNVIQAVKNWNERGFDPVLEKACQQLKLNTSLTDLCISLYKDLYPEAKHTEIHHKTRNILSNLQTQSVLKVVHSTFSLKYVPPDRVTEMLSLTQGDLPSDSSLHLTDKAVYSGYLALCIIMEAIHLSCEYKDLLFLKKINMSDLLHTDAKTLNEMLNKEAEANLESTNESLSDYINNHGAQNAYAMFVYKKLKKAEQEIRTIFPINFRVEILENIFSLLFAMSNVLGDSLEPSSDSDQGHEGELLTSHIETNHHSSQNDNTHSSENEKMFSGRFVISTIKLKDYSEARYSGHLSSKSTESNSSSALQSYTFLCNELITRDLLNLLKDLIIGVKAVVYKTITQTDTTLNNKVSSEAPVSVESSAGYSNLSISTTELPERASRLLQYVNEALWRYEVVKSGIFQGTFGMSPLQKKKPYLFQSQISASSSDGTDVESKKRKKKKKQKRSFSSLKKESFAESSIIQCMLSSPEALLRYSLWSKNLMQAQQVIKLFHLEASDEAKELVLVQELQRISGKLAENEKMKNKLLRRNSMPVLEGKSLMSNIQAIEEAAATGLRSSEICLIIHKELSSLKVPEILDITDGVKHPELLLGSKNIYSIFIADLGCTSGVSLDLSSVLLEMASRTWSTPQEKPLDLDAKVLSKKKMPLIRGVFKTLNMMNSFSTEFINFIQNNDEEDLKLLFLPLNKNYSSFSSVISNFFGNLDSQRFKGEINSWKETSDLLKDFIDLLKEEEEMNEKNGISEKDITRENKLHIMYKKLSKVLRELRDWSSETIRPQQVRYDNYLSKLLVHLHQVTSAVLDCKRQSSETDSTVYTSDFSILKESPVELLKKIILQSGVTPDKIEKFAIRMKVDLVHVLAQACLPHVPLQDKRVSSDKLLQSVCYYNDGGFPSLILNKSKGEWLNPRHPDIVARELLRDLIAIMQDTILANDSCGIFSIQELLSLTQHSEIASWMEECTELAFVDLDLLQSRKEKLAFFVNVTNIAFLHAILLEVTTFHSQDNEASFSSDYSESNVSFQSYFQMISPNILERLTMQKIVGYCVGQLGPVSLFDLRYQLLHAQLPIPLHLREPPFYHLLGNYKPEWEKYAPPLEPQILFVLVEGLLYSPKLQVMYSDDFDYQLGEAMKDYFDFTVNIDHQEKTLSIPILLRWYTEDFSNKDDDDLEKAKDEGLLKLLSSSGSLKLANFLNSFLCAVSELDPSENIDTSGKEQRSLTLIFKPPLSSCGIMLSYTDSNTLTLENNSVKPVPVLDTQPCVLNYLKDKCSILNDLYEIFRSKLASEYLSIENLCLETSVQTLFSTEDSETKVPVTVLLSYYKKMLVSSNDEYSWFSSALSPSPDKAFLSQQIKVCFSKNEWHRALLFVDMYLECFENDETYILLRKLILEHLASVNKFKSSMDPCNYALCIRDPAYRANIVLQNVYKWEDHPAVQALKFCLSDYRIINYPEVHKCLQRKLKEVLLYKKIFDASEMFDDSDAKDCVYVFNNWQEVADCSVWDQSRILDFIKSSGKYNLAVQWSELHIINSEQKMLALSMNVIWHLTQDPSQEQAVFEIIDSFEDPSECIMLCDMVLPELPTIESKLYLVQYLVDNNISPEKQYHYFNMALGLKMLCALKSPNKELYSDLAAHPYILLEQMLMNVELKDAELALKAVYDDLKEENIGIAPILTLSSVDQLVEDYASKALEVHFLDSLLDVSSSSTLVLSTEETLVSDEPFMMPLRVPTKDEWVPDAKIERCQVCREERFNMFSRRHHCRRCGRVVCANCSQHALIVEGYGNVKVRVCDDCYNGMTGSLSLTTASFEKRYRVLSSMRSSSPRNSPYQTENLGLRRRSSSIQVNQQAFRWVLSADHEQNASVRNEFSYEQTPSISLCYSILKLHNDDKKCAQFLMNLSDRLLGKIKMKRSGKLPLEVDYSLIISMMKSLLLNAKMKCHQVQDNEGEALAGLYFQHLDVIKLLVNANCRHLIPREVLTNKDTVRKLRDRLLEEERMNLALEISTKFNLDKTGVWSTWGLFCLKAGDWPTARQKFQQCLKVINDKNDKTKENPLLNKILKVLENSKYPGIEKATDIFKSLAVLKNIKLGSSQFETEMSPLNELIKKECLFYLKMYGTHFGTVEFYHRHGLLNEALDYILQMKCDPDIFIEALFMPILKSAQLLSLKDIITVIDPSLILWSPYLFATCRYLERFKYSNVLYELQIFMEDYARAAKSAITFYLAPAPSYKIMFDRHRHLHNAKKHYEKYLAYCKETDSVSELWKKRKNIKHFPVKEVESYIQLINLQDEVIKFLKLCESRSSIFLYEGDELQSNSKCPPTLFGNAQTRNEVVSMILINAVNVDEGFELAIKLLKTYNLNATVILCKVGQDLVKTKQKHQIPHYLTCVKCLFFKMVKVDDVILECVSALHTQARDVEEIIKMLTSDSNKINAYLMCGKLKSAYLLAIKLNSALDVRRIMIAAEQCGQESIQSICKKWLETKSLKLKPKESVPFQ
ncbi:zinc finger FYVE domain-containing protein 26 [Nephila pilipes]|uniref:Zinc finger FYVE domain-containing protein 26 n=1 Tax=Nephila pilipes TaxID=299642 RepID=A0A8X6US18_NEPPI|nr:zinc finger FYVE domain-containing protein 26 [Nephila pilipes]